MQKKKKLIEIDKENTVLWMDKNGHWHNEQGAVEKKSIIRYLNTSIECDEKGYYLTHMLGETKEKVYFHYEDTALFIIDIQIRPKGLSALLNTRRRISIQPQNLFLKGDHLYLTHGRERIKLNERSMVQLSPLFQGNEETLIITFAGQTCRIPSQN